MHGNITTRLDDAAIDSSRVDWDITVVGDPEPERIPHYRVTVFDRETGVFIGSAFVPAGPGGRPPAITVGDVLALIGGYRIASVYVEIEAERLARVSQRVSNRERRRARGWLRSVPRSILAEHGIGPAPRRRTRS
jgi:hypothetical protein